MAFRIIVLGSGTIIPSIERRATSLLVEAGGEHVLFDCGPGTLEALEEHGFSFRSLRIIFLTHYHPDHSLGLAHLLAALNADPAASIEHVITVYGPVGLRELVVRLQACYRSIIPKRHVLELIEIGEGVVPRGAAASISAAAASHGDAAALAYRVDFEGMSVVFTGDTSFSESLVQFSKGADFLFAECSFPDSRPIEGHLTPAVVGRLAAAAGVGRVILVHMYPLFDGADPIAGVKKQYGGPVDIAYDSMEFDVETKVP
jgi:ribonuclease BN (tRNA processing enzyme)